MKATEEEKKTPRVHHSTDFQIIERSESKEDGVLSSPGDYGSGSFEEDQDIEQQNLSIRTSNLKPKKHPSMVDAVDAIGSLNSTAKSPGRIRSQHSGNDARPIDSTILSAERQDQANELSHATNKSLVNHVASDYLPGKKRNQKKQRVIRPKFANNPLAVCQVYFPDNPGALLDMESKMTPWEKNYFQSLNNRVRGAQSVTAGDSKSIFQFAQQQTTNQDLTVESKHNQTGQQAQIRKYARSLRRSTQPPQAETMSVNQSLNGNRSLPPLREQQHHTVSPRRTHPNSLSTVVKMKKNLVKRAAMANHHHLLKKTDGSSERFGNGPNEQIITNTAAPNEYDESAQNDALMLPPKFFRGMDQATRPHQQQQLKDRYRNMNSVSSVQESSERVTSMNNISFSPRKSNQNQIAKDYATTPMTASGSARQSQNARFTGFSRSRFRTIDQHTPSSPSRKLNQANQPVSKRKSGSRGERSQQVRGQRTHQSFSRKANKFNNLSKSQLHMANNNPQTVTMQSVVSTQKTSPHAIHQRSKDRFSVHLPASTKSAIGSFQHANSHVSPRRHNVDSRFVNQDLQSHHRVPNVSKSLATNPNRQRLNRHEQNNLVLQESQIMEDFNQETDQQSMANNSIQTIPRYTPTQNNRQENTMLKKGSGSLEVQRMQKSQQELHTVVAVSPSETNVRDKEADNQGDMVRMQSGRRPFTNATILRDHIKQIKKVFSNFADQHQKLVANDQAKPIEAKLVNSKQDDKAKISSLESEVEMLKKQLAERDALIVKLSKLRTAQPPNAHHS